MLRQIGLLGLFAVLATPAQATAPSKLTQLEQPQTAHIPFDPPIDKPVRYRWEKSVHKDEKTRSTWSISEYRFTRVGDGFELQVTPIDSGTSETDPTTLAAYRQLEQLISRPFILQLGADGTINSMKDQDHYWSAIVSVLKEALSKRPPQGADEAAFRTAANGVIQFYETMPAETRLTLLTESVQPLVEFGGTETTVGEPLIASLDTASPFGGTLKQDVNVRLERVEGDKAHLVVGSSIPRAELQKLAEKMLCKLLTGKQEAEIKAGLAALQKYRHDTVATFVVSTRDGMLESYSSSETIEVQDNGKVERRITTKTLSQTH